MVAGPEYATQLMQRAQRRDAWHWRFFVTALSFFVFVVGAPIAGLILTLLSLVPGRRLRRQQRARAVLRAMMRGYVGFMSGLGGMTYEVRGSERLGRPGQLIVANHPSFIDVAFLMAFAPDAVCVVKDAMRRNLVTRGVVGAAGYISNQPAANMIENAAAALAAGRSLIMFPEGTRSVPGQPLVFHRGAANVAIRAARTVTPVYILVTPTTLTKADPWYRIPPRRPHFALLVGEDLAVDEFREGRPVSIASRALNEHLQAHFQGELRRLESYTNRIGSGPVAQTRDS